jgi:putative DNA primase/helicase
MNTSPLEKLLRQAEGKWPSVLAACGVDSKLLTGRNQPCPMCGGRDRFRFMLNSTRADGRWICSGCMPQTGSGFDLIMSIKRCDLKEAMRMVGDVVGSATPVRQRAPDDKAMRASLNELWRKATPIRTDDPVDKYLRRRMLPLPDQRYLRTIEDLKYHDNPPSWHWGMLAMVLGPDGKPSTLHRTYLTNDGRKAPVEAVRRLHAGRVAKGGAVRCIPMKADWNVLGIAEGIETALAAFRLTGIPCWAAVSAPMLEAWVPPPEAERVVIFGDSDKSYTGQAAAYSLAKRLTLVDKIVAEVQLPSWGGPTDEDWNDILMRGGENGLHERGKAGSAPAGTEVPAASVRAADRGGHDDASLRQGAD